MSGVRDRLERFLLRGERTGLTAEDLRRANLAGFAYTTLRSGNPLRGELRADFAVAALRHIEIKAQMMPLLEACHSNDLEVVPYKGFAHAQLLYDAPAARFYGDVDLLIHSGDERRIVALALSLGWRLHYLKADLKLLTTHPAVLMSPGNAVMLELHSAVLQTHNRVSKRLTTALLEGVLETKLEGVAVRVLQPVDALLVMYLNRAWGDLWGRKPHDYLDARQLIAKHGVTLQALRTRAAALGIGRVLAAAMESCDPWQQRLHLGRAPRATVWGWGLRAFPSWGAFAVEQIGVKLRSLPLAISVVREAWGTLGKVDAALRTHVDLNEALRSLTPAVVSAGDPNRLAVLTLHRVIGLRWALRLQRRSARSCVPRSLALFRALRLEGYEVAFVSGVALAPGATRLDGHAWVEWQGKPLSGSGDERASTLFRASFRYPAAD